MYNQTIQYFSAISILFFFSCCTSVKNNNEIQQNKVIETTTSSIVNQTDDKPLEKTFENFLSFFQTDSNYLNWTEVMHPIIGEESNKGLYASFNGPYNFNEQLTLIPEELLSFLNLRDLKKLVKDPQVIPLSNPDSSYEFYAHKKKEFKNIWIVNYLAKKKFVGLENDKINAHALVLCTYTQKGEFIDNFIWNIFEQDLQEVWDDINMSNDTFLIGRKTNYDLIVAPLETIYSKTILKENGVFENVYKNYEEGYTCIER